MPKIEVEEELKDILPGFLTNREKDVVDLKAAQEQTDLKTIEKIGHRVAGSSGGYGFGELGDIAKEMELAAKAGDLLTVSEKIKEFEVYMSDIEIVFV